MPSYKSVLSEIYSIDSSYKLGLDRMEAILKDLGDPHLGLKVVHVAGSNGKGSVCSMIRAVLMGCGHTVGMYTSPHLMDLRERFTTDNILISRKELVSYYDRIRPLVKKHKPTYFEALTAMAFLYFKEKKVDYFVLEVGLGGRLDATNVVKPILSVITNISMEHKEWLGDTIPKIAYEKAGIIKQGVPVVTGATGQAFEVIEAMAHRREASLIVASREEETNLQGDFQRRNAGVAYEAMAALGIEKDSIRKGLLDASWPGRFQFLEKDVLVDCAHNPAAAEVLVDNIKRLSYRKIVAVVGILRDKDSSQMIEELKSLEPHFIFCRPRTPRAIDPQDLRKHALNSEVVEKPKEALARAREIEHDLILVTGSIFTVGDVMRSHN